MNFFVVDFLCVWYVFDEIVFFDFEVYFFFEGVGGVDFDFDLFG